MASVICFGQDKALVQTRQWILQREQHSVHAAMSTADFREQLLAHPIDLVILCQTLTTEDCEAALRYTSEHSPHTRCLLFYAQQWPVPDLKHTMLVLGSGPLELTHAVRELVHGMGGH